LRPDTDSQGLQIGDGKMSVIEQIYSYLPAETIDTKDDSFSGVLLFCAIGPLLSIIAMMFGPIAQGPIV
jgi:hypothetical protein